MSSTSTLKAIWLIRAYTYFRSLFVEYFLLMLLGCSSAKPAYFLDVQVIDVKCYATAAQLILPESYEQPLILWRGETRTVGEFKKACDELPENAFARLTTTHNWQSLFKYVFDGVCTKEILFNLRISDKVT